LKKITAFEKFFLFWVPMNILKDWKAKLESAYYKSINQLQPIVRNLTRKKIANEVFRTLSSCSHSLEKKLQNKH
jgi:hypothetical protein